MPKHLQTKTMTVAYHKKLLKWLVSKKKKERKKSLYFYTPCSPDV